MTSNGATRGLDGITTALDRVTDWVDPSKGAAIIVFVTPFVDAPVNSEALPAAQSLALRATESHVPIYVLHTNLVGQLPEPLQTLAQNSGGEYLLLPQEQSTLGPALESFYASMIPLRGYYTLSYRSRVGDSGPRRVQVSLTDGSSVSAEASYMISLSPATVLLTSPASGTDLEVPRKPENPLDAIHIASAIESWPDGHPRQIASAQLLVNGDPIPEAEAVIGTDTVEITWLPSPDQYDNKSQVQIAVQTVDELGITSTTVPVDVSLSFKGGASTTLIILGSVLAMLLITAAGTTGFLLLRRRGMQPIAAVRSIVPGYSQAEPIKGSPRKVSNTLVSATGDFPEESGTVTGSLQVIEGPADLIDQRIPIKRPRMILGRDPDTADAAFFVEEQSSVSGAHCTITYLRGEFLLQDSGSRNGTFLNGQRVSPDQGYSLQDGDEIVLGKVAMNGVKLVAQLSQRSPRVQTDRAATQVDPADHTDPGTGRNTTVEMDDDDDDLRPASADNSASDDDWMDDLG